MADVPGCVNITSESGINMMLMSRRTLSQDSLKNLRAALQRALRRVNIGGGSVDLETAVRTEIRTYNFGEKNESQVWIVSSDGVYTVDTFIVF